MRKFVILILLFSFFVSAEAAQHKGLWVSVFSDRRPLYSKKGALELIQAAKAAGIDEIYLQVYQSGNAYYNSALCEKSKFDQIYKSCGFDPILFLLREARANNIKVFAWINVLSLGKNKDASIIKKFDDSILTRDQYLKTSVNDEAHDLDKYYQRENQLFLDPGDPRVRQYTLDIALEIMTKYPLFSGVHLDYIRYPAIVPFVHGSRFNKFGLTYGYNRISLGRFNKKTGLDPLAKNFSDNQSIQWDDWKRSQVTELVEEVSRQVKARSKKALVSCAVISGPERSYVSFFQDWPLWLEKGIIDYVVLMDYSRDSRLVKEIAASALGLRGNGKVFIGLGLFLMKDDPGQFLSQYRSISSLNPDGIVIFSYDDLSAEVIRSIK
ncbi:MAG: family 10 glycosylhydrolase [Candidatus Omnitrophica bacterium]|nr:family 10 glycosylhydrolase [Candidatus Omnitrophota bacterium]MBU1869876.1 family 10 glycosylhydrolase [Candidatus Omnitrophota bacterium]